MIYPLSVGQYKQKSKRVNLNYSYKLRHESFYFSFCNLMRLNTYHFNAICQILCEIRQHWLGKSVLTRQEYEDN